MKKRTCLRFGIVCLAALAIILVYLWLTAPKDRINLASFEQISDSMTQADVETILRVPPGKHSSASAMIEFKRPDGSSDAIAVDEAWPTDEELQAQGKDTGRRAALWAGDRGMIMILFNADNRVTEKQFIPICHQGLVARVRNLLAKLF